MKSIEWIEKLKAEKNLPSDRQAALLLGMTTASMSAHRQGHSTTLEDRFAYRIEAELGLPHGRIVLDQHAEREKDPEIQAMWRRLAGGAASLIITAALLSTLGPLGTPTANADTPDNHNYRNIDSFHWA